MFWWVGGNLAYIGSTLPTDLGTLTPGQSVWYKLTFTVPSSVREFILKEGVSFQDETGNIQANSFTQKIFP